MHLILAAIFFFPFLFSSPPSQVDPTFVSYRSGPVTDTLTLPLGGVCLMGGAREDDEAMRWFLRRANGGDVLVLRASGSDGYNDYLYRELGVPVHSVETIRFDSLKAKEEDYIHRRIQEAEAIWIAGGNQWNYVRFWRNTKIDSLINQGIRERHMAIGGTSAGMAILGGIYFSAQAGTVHSKEAIAEPYRKEVKVDTSTFLQVPYLAKVITDTHYSERKRQGRHAVFLGRILKDTGIAARGIACDERTAIGIDTNGHAYVFGRGVEHKGHAFFIQVNCSNADFEPEQCQPGRPMLWMGNRASLKVYQIQGTPEGDRYFDLKDWQEGKGGSWKHWYLDQQQLHSIAGTAPDCSSP